MTFPDDENGRLLLEMHNEGIDLSQSHKVDFFHLFEKKPQAEKMAQLIQQSHPETEVKVFEDETPGVWDVCCTIKMVPDYDNICEMEKTFESVADKCDGYADGWGIMA